MASWWFARGNSSKKVKKDEIPTVTYVEPHNEFDGKGISLYLYGGISQCPDWQSDVRHILAQRCPLMVVLNPRRRSYDLKDTSQTEMQILWEYTHSRKADAIMFWFCAESICPIALYQLGAWTQICQETGTKLFIGCHPEYTRMCDLTVQTQLALGDSFKVYTSLGELIDQIELWYKNF